jgi:excisionase family DNA binding protein
MRKRPSGRGIKLHRSYSVEEAARALQMAKGTVLRWLRSGALPALKDQRPFLVLGSELIAFLDKRKIGRVKCRLHEAYCFTCRAASEPANRKANYQPRNSAAGMLEAHCSTCGGIMFKRVSRAKIPDLQEQLDLTIKQAPSPIDEHP